jgi:hypothetical protein
MMALRVCPSCSRHAREVMCPFCGAEIPQLGAVITVPRVSRSGLLGIAATAIVVGACSSTAPQPAYGIAIPDAEPSDGQSDGFGVAHYGGPPFDASLTDGNEDAGSD